MRERKHARMRWCVHVCVCVHIIIVMHIHKFLSATSWDNLGPFLDLILVLDVPFVIMLLGLCGPKDDFEHYFSITFAKNSS